MAALWGIMGKAPVEVPIDFGWVYVKLNDIWTIVHNHVCKLWMSPFWAP